MFRPKGPYRVIDKANPGSCNLQQLPFHKEAAFRMERILSTLVLHKRTDGADSQFLAMNQRPATAPAPPKKWLRVIKCGAYKKVAGDEDYAFKRLANMWSVEIENNSDSNSDSTQKTPTTNPLTAWPPRPRRPPIPLCLCQLAQEYSIASTS